MNDVVQHIRLRDASDDELMQLSEHLHLSLSLEEMRRIRRYFKEQGRDPTDIELQSIAQAWSEHCCYKSSRRILQKFILSTSSEASICVDEDAGVVEFDDEHAYVVAFESHNHPSAIEPYGGAATGIGGVVRDVVCMGAQPIALIDPLFFGPLEYPHENLPKGVKHPRYLFEGVIAGISDYGNRIGIPTCAGMVFFDEGFIGNCIVNVGCVGIMKKSDIIHSIAYPDEVLVLVGGPTGRDGIHGVTFASAKLGAEEEFRSAVQLGDPIRKEPLIHAILEAREFISGMKDLGGGGLSCAVIEMCAAGKCSADIHLERVTLKEEGMLPWEIWISESQERFLICTARENVAELIEIFENWDIDASVIGETRKTNGNEKIRVFYNDRLIYELELAFITNTPIYERKRKTRSIKEKEVEFHAPHSYEEIILSMLRMHNIASKEYVVRRYDFDVRASTVIKPIHGIIGCETHSDAVVLKPLENSFRGIALTADVNPSYTRLNPFWGAASAVDEACRNIVAVGARPHAFADCLNFGSPERDYVMGDFYECCRALGFMSSALGTPFVSGNVSFYNENEATGEPIPPTPSIIGIGICDDVRYCITVDAKIPSNPLYIIGDTKNELGGSAYFRLIGVEGGIVPRTSPRELRKRMDALLDAMREGFVVSCHDISEGGLAVAVCEMISGGDLGAEIDLGALGELRSDIKLFSETNSRWIVEVKRSKEDDFVHEMTRRGVFVRRIGELKRDKSLVIYDGENEVNISINALREAWRNAFGAQ